MTNFLVESVEMAKVERLVTVVGEGEADLLHGLPSDKKEPQSLYNLALRTKDVLVAKNVVEEVRKRIMQFRGESKAEKEKEKVERVAELKVEEKSRAAAWAWYQHGNSGAIPSGSPNCLSNRAARKASRFKTEAQKVGNNSGRVEPRWDFETSLFDSYELDSVSKQIDHAFHENYKPLAHSTPPPQAKLFRSHSLRLSFPRSLCRSISDVVTHEEMALGVRRCECSKERSRRPGGGWSFRRISKAIHVLMHVPGWDVQSHEQHQLHHHEHHHHHHQHEHEHHHHHHYSVRLKDGSHYGKSFSNIERVKAADAPFPSYPRAR